MSEKKKPEVFANEVRAIWGDSVELLTPYTRGVDNVLVRFKACNHEQWKRPHKLLAGHGCDHPDCKNRKLSATKTLSREQFLDSLSQKGLRYELLSDYTGSRNPVTVKNLACGHIYTARAGNIIYKESGCPVCHGFKDTEVFRGQVESRYPGEYEVIGDYVNNRTSIRVKHKSCGYEWDVIPKDLLHDFRCPYCNRSLGEKLISNFLESHSLRFTPQYKFQDCAEKRPLPFDFAVFTDDGIKLIEFDGSQHFRSRGSGWNTDDNISDVKRRDKIKNDYCLHHNIPLLRIPYWKIRSVDTILASFLGIVS